MRVCVSLMFVIYSRRGLDGRPDLEKLHSALEHHGRRRRGKIPPATAEQSIAVLGILSRYRNLTRGAITRCMESTDFRKIFDLTLDCDKGLDDLVEATNVFPVVIPSPRVGVRCRGYFEHLCYRAHMDFNDNVRMFVPSQRPHGGHAMVAVTKVCVAQPSDSSGIGHITGTHCGMDNPNFDCSLAFAAQYRTLIRKNDLDIVAPVNGDFGQVQPILSWNDKQRRIDLELHHQTWAREQYLVLARHELN